MQLVASGISHSYGPLTVLDDVSLTVSTGEWIALVGPSGSGKTTLLSIIGGLQRADEGDIAVVCDQGRPGPVQVAWVLQTTTALGRRSTLDNAAVGGLSAGASSSTAARDAREMLARVGLNEHADAPARTLSGGEKQRLAIARALCQGRPFLLADEPTGQLDAATSAAVITSMRDATTEVGVILATHDRRLQSWCDRMLALDGGTLG